MPVLQVSFHDTGYAIQVKLDQQGQQVVVDLVDLLAQGVHKVSLDLQGPLVCVVHKVRPVLQGFRVKLADRENKDSEVSLAQLVLRVLTVSSVLWYIRHPWPSRMNW